MRVLPYIILCLFMAFCVLANDDSANDDSANDNSANNNSENDDVANTDFVLGERKENDYLAYTKLYSVSKNSRLRTIRIPVFTRSSREVITQIKLRNTGQETQLPTITVLKDINQRFLLLRAERKPNQAISMSMEVYLLNVAGQTTTTVTTPSPTTVADTSNDDDKTSDD